MNCCNSLNLRSDSPSKSDPISEFCIAGEATANASGSQKWDLISLTICDNAVAVLSVKMIYFAISIFLTSSNVPAFK